MELSRRSALAGLAFASLDAGCAGHEFPPRTPIAFRGAKRFFTLDDGLRMAYYEAGQGEPIVFLHGNPTSSYLWRNVIPHLAGQGRCIAPDLVGMGDSDKLPEPGPGRYNFFEHSRRLDALLDAVDARHDVTLVVHDWGGPLGFYWAMRNQARVKAIAFMETFVVSQNDANTPQFAMQFFSRFRTQDGERDVLMHNAFVETVLLRQFPNMPKQDREEYRRPFAVPGEGRWPTLEWPRQVPLNGDPVEVHEVTLRFLRFMSETPIPKLFIRAEPGALILGGRELIPRAWPRTTEVVVQGRHFLPEESPDEIGRAIATWRYALGR